MALEVAVGEVVAVIIGHQSTSPLDKRLGVYIYGQIKQVFENGTDSVLISSAVAAIPHLYSRAAIKKMIAPTQETSNTFPSRLVRQDERNQMKLLVSQLDETTTIAQKCAILMDTLDRFAFTVDGNDFNCPICFDVCCPPTCPPCGHWFVPIFSSVRTR